MLARTVPSRCQRPRRSTHGARLTARSAPSLSLAAAAVAHPPSSVLLVSSESICEDARLTSPVPFGMTGYTSIQYRLIPYR